MVFEQPSHQTGGVFLRASGDAVLDADAVEFRHRGILTGGLIHNVRRFGRQAQQRLKIVRGGTCRDAPTRERGEDHLLR
jgi:hypothetical protein